MNTPTHLKTNTPKNVQTESSPNALGSTQNNNAARQNPSLDEDGHVTLWRYQNGALHQCDDTVACEEPLEIRINGMPVAVLMRTPYRGHDAVQQEAIQDPQNAPENATLIDDNGHTSQNIKKLTLHTQDEQHDVDLAIGYVLTEKMIDSYDDIQRVFHSSEAAIPEVEDNIVQVLLKPHITLDWQRVQRRAVTASSCGVCSKASISAVVGFVRTPSHLGTATPTNPRSQVQIDASFVPKLPDLLGKAQRQFAQTGGLHAAGLFRATSSTTGFLSIVREDIGRHNAVDSVIGYAARMALDCTEHILVVSGRISFEIAQKAAISGIPMIVAVSAPSALAIDIAHQVGMTLIGFIRGQKYNIYTHPWRICA